MHVAELNNSGTESGERMAVCGSSERRTTVALALPCTEKLYSAVRKKQFLENMTRRLEAALDWYVGLAARSSDLSRC